MKSRDGNVVREKGKYDANSIILKEKGETVTFLACINASGN
jgi:hypothetical protein